MEQHSALPSINGKTPEVGVVLKAEVPVTRPSSSIATGGRRALGVLPKSAGATTASRRISNSDTAGVSGWNSTGNQVQRRLATHVASRGVSADRMVVQVTTNHVGGYDHSSFQQGHSYEREDPSYDSRDEVQQLRNENATFRQENDLLRTKLVEKMRGQSKVVAGGQFRAASASASSTKVPTAPSLACTKCMLARTKAVKAHHESEQAQIAVAELRKHLHRLEAVQTRLCEERSLHLAEIAQLRDKLTEKAEECVVIEEQCANLGKQVKMLQPENEEAGITVDEAIQCTLRQSADEVIKGDQLREIEASKAKIQLLTRQLDEREQEITRISYDFEESRAAARLVKDERDREARLWLDDSSELMRRIVELEQGLESSQKSLQDHQMAHQKECKLFEQVSQKLLTDIKSKEKALEILAQKHQDEVLALEQKHETLVHALKVRMAQKVADVDRLHALVSELSADKVTKTVLTKQIENYEIQVETLMKEKSELAADNLARQQRNGDCSQADYNSALKQGEEERDRLSEALKTAEHDNLALQTRITEVKADLAEQLSLLQRQKQSHARAMERLAESSLRLCVVAPTVNVQLNTNGAQLSSKNSTVSLENNDSTNVASVVCRSTPQQDSIKQVIEKEVLPLFTSVFLQGDDNASPQAAIPMTRWLHELLQDMQTRIAAQLESIYSTAVENSSG